MNKRVRNYIVAVAVYVAIWGTVTLAGPSVDKAKKTQTYKELELFADALAYIQTQYVDQTQPKDIIYGAMAGMMASLDPHSQFLIPEEYEDLKVDTEGKFGGIGIEITIKDNLATVITPIEGTPAWEAGLLPNDRIVKIDDTVMKNATLNDTVKRLRGDPGTEVILTIWREKDDNLQVIPICRAIIDVKDIKDAKVLEEGIGYIRIVEFREDTPKELDRVLRQLSKTGMDSLIVDLRNNPGGLLDQAVEVAQRFLPKDSLIVSIRGRDKDQNADFRSDYGNADVNMPLIILVNEGSASGSEIVAGALQDYKRAVVMGTRTFGKGSVQTVLPLSDGSALKLTTSRYFTPLGRTIQDTGISPDIIVESQETLSQKEVQAQSRDEERIDQIFQKVDSPEQPQKPEAQKPELKSSQEQGQTCPVKEEPVLPLVQQEQQQRQEELRVLYSADPQLARAIDLMKSIKIYQSFSKAAK